MLIYLLLLLSIIIISYSLFGTMCLIGGRFCLLGWPQLLVFSQPSLNLFCSFAIARVSILLSVWMTFWFWFTLKWAGKRITHFCFPYWFSLDYILIFFTLKWAGKRITHFCFSYWFSMDYILIFPSLTFSSCRPFISWGYVGLLSACQYLWLLIS